MAIKCEACGRAYYDSVMRVCPKKDGEHWICLYCCHRCKRQYRVGTLWGCRAFDEQKSDENGKAKDEKKKSARVDDREAGRDNESGMES